MRCRAKEILIVLCCYAVHASVYASQITLWQSLNDGNLLVDAAINLMSAVCAAVANLAFRLKKQEIAVDHFGLELASGIGVGLVAGVVAYSLSRAADANVFLQLALVTIAGWGGSKVIEAYQEKYFGRVDREEEP